MPAGPGPGGEAHTAGSDRGQTLIDYSAGISIFLLAVAFSFTFVPSFVTPFQAPIHSDQTVQSERVAIGVLGNLTRNTSASVINETNATDFFAAGTYPANGDDLRQRYRLPDYTRVNVTLKTPSGQPDLTVGDPYRDTAVAAATRIVTDNGTPDRCQPTCRLIVRVW